MWVLQNLKKTCADCRCSYWPADWNIDSGCWANGSWRWLADGLQCCLHSLERKHLLLGTAHNMWLRQQKHETRGYLCFWYKWYLGKAWKSNNFILDRERISSSCQLPGQHRGFRWPRLAQKNYLDLIHGSKTWVTGGLQIQLFTLWWANIAMGNHNFWYLSQP